jgi:hypothetical protein
MLGKLIFMTLVLFVLGIAGVPFWLLLSIAFAAIATAKAHVETKVKPIAKARPLYDFDAHWRPCRNPQCRAPIYETSRRLYCDDTCQQIAKQMRQRSDAANDPTLRECPF